MTTCGSIKKYILVSLLIGYVCSTANAGETEIGSIERTPVVEVFKLRQFRGQFLNVFFVEASNAPVTFDPYRNLNLDVRSLKAKPIQLRIDSDEVRIPSVEIQKRPFKFAYNFALIVISPNEDFSWMNNDGSRPLPLEWQTRNTIKNVFRAIPRAALLDESTLSNAIFRISLSE